MYCDYLRPAGYDHEIMLCLPSGPGRTVRLMFLTRTLTSSPF
jgi:hypothetical protein